MAGPLVGAASEIVAARWRNGAVTSRDRREERIHRATDERIIAQFENYQLRVALPKRFNFDRSSSMTSAHRRDASSFSNTNRRASVTSVDATMTSLRLCEEACISGVSCDSYDVRRDRMRERFITCEEDSRRVCAMPVRVASTFMSIDETQRCVAACCEDMNSLLYWQMQALACH
ncbi:hypothetical protein [Panacagrimonas perspica]|uniref:hypothetical protein n=1 Tax=Panacagrimonas perspica TaxID=381431 RepID=UPI0013C2A5BE|nr:hypothetical protein [Panacagrimonas perspica]